MAISFSFRYQPVLGTDLHVLVGCEAATAADLAQRRVLEEILRLEDLLSTYRVDTPLSQWMLAAEGQAPEGKAPKGELPDEVVTVLALARDWFITSGGVFHPGLGRVRKRWWRAELDGRPPDRDECRLLAAQSESLPFVIETVDGVRRVQRTGDCSDLDLDALAKGWIVDRAAEVGVDSTVSWVMVNVGGDIRVAGPGSVRVAIEDPRSAIDNAEPVAVVTMGAGGMASSGPARRGFQVGGQWFGHVLDPRTGWPVQGTGGVTVVAADTVTADALATVVGVEGLDRPLVQTLLTATQATALVVGDERTVQVSRRWRDDVGIEVMASD